MKKILVLSLLFLCFGIAQTKKDTIVVKEQKTTIVKSAKFEKAQANYDAMLLKLKKAQEDADKAKLEVEKIQQEELEKAQKEMEESKIKYEKMKSEFNTK